MIRLSSLSVSAALFCAPAFADPPIDFGSTSCAAYLTWSVSPELLIAEAQAAFEVAVATISTLDGTSRDEASIALARACAVDPMLDLGKAIQATFGPGD